MAATIEILERKITEEERELLHQLLDEMCDKGRVGMMQEMAEIDENYHLKRTRYYIHIGIEEVDE